jgi:DNA-binding NarL/FixJ family response regulator
MNGPRYVQPNAEAIAKLQREVRLAAQAYFRAANAHKEAIVNANAQGWKFDEDGQQSLYSAAQCEHDALERYAQLVNALKDAFRAAPKPAKRRNTRASDLEGRPLSPREREVLKLIADGLSSREISEKLRISFNTAVAHRYHIMGKLQIHDVVTLVRYALQNELVKP